MNPVELVLPGAVVLAITWLVLAAILSIAVALISRGGLVLWAIGLAVVRSNGAPASRWRVAWRALVAWLPILMLPLVAAFGFAALKAAYLGGNLPAIAAGFVLAVVYLAICIWSALLPGRGIPDRLAGTWLVPR